MLKIGVRAHDYGKRSPEELFKLIASDNFDAVMLAYQKAIEGVSNYFDVTSELIERVKKALLENNLEIDTLGVYRELGLCDEKLRKNEVKHFIQGMKVAKETGVLKVSTETTAFSKQPKVTKEEAYNSLKKSLEEILPIAEKLGMFVCVEPVYYHTLDSPELTKKLILEMGSQNLKVTFDAVNLLERHNVEKQREYWDETIEMLYDHIELVHMKGIMVNSENQLVSTDLRKSIIDYKYIFDKLKAKSVHVIREEQNPDKGKDESEFLKSFL